MKFLTKIKKVYSISALFIVMQLLLAACADSRVAGPPFDWQSRWLNGVPCRLPCWEGITPGKTTSGEAVQVLGKNPLFSQLKDNLSANPKEILQTITWDWNFSTGSRGGEIDYSNTSNSIIVSIRPNFYTTYKLPDVIKHFGEPTHVNAGFVINPDFSISFKIRVIYLTKGFSLSHSDLVKKDEKAKPQFDAATDFEVAEFYEPAADSSGTYNGVLKPNVLIPWEGFKGFEFYCRELNGVDKCNRVFGGGG